MYTLSMLGDDGKVSVAASAVEASVLPGALGCGGAFVEIGSTLYRSPFAVGENIRAAVAAGLFKGISPASNSFTTAGRLTPSRSAASCGATVGAPAQSSPPDPEP